MKQIIKIAHLVIFILLCEVSYAQTKQTQNAVVKTPERRNINGQITPAKYWDNATVTVMTAGESSKQSYVSGKGGKVGIPAPKPFYVVEASANKGTYTLMDGQFKNKRHSYSATEELDILVDDPYALANAKTEGKQIMKKRLQDSIQAAKNMTEQQYKDGKITEEKYKEQTAQLKNELDSLEKRVENIVIAFLTTDIGKLNGFNKELFIAVEDGDFARVDSLLKTQPSCETIFEEIKEGEATITLAKERTPNRKALLQRLSEKSQEKKEALFQRLYTECLYFMQRPLMQDSALHRLKMRANLDTTNMDAVKDYAYLCLIQNKFSDCEKYYYICLRAYQQNQDMPNIAAIQNSLGLLFNARGIYDTSETYLKQALENFEQLFKENPDAYRADLAATQMNLGLVYNARKNFDTSETYYKLALENYEQLFKVNPDAYRANLAMTQMDLGVLNLDREKYDNSEKYLKQALENFELLFKVNPDAYREFLAATQMDLGLLYNARKNFDTSETYLKQALENLEQLFKENPDAYRADLAATQMNLGIQNLLYRKKYGYSERYLKQALENFKLLFKADSNAYREFLAMTQMNLGVLNLDRKKYDNSERYLKQALEKFELLFKADSNAHRANLAMTQMDLGVLNLYREKYDNSERYLKQALEKFELLFKADSNAYREFLAMTYFNIMQLYAAKEDIKKCKAVLAKALELYTTLFAMDETNEQTRLFLATCYYYEWLIYAEEQRFKEAVKSIDKAISLMPTNADYYDGKGAILLIQGKEKEALAMWKKVLELNPDFLKENPGGTNLSNGLRERGLITK